MKITENENEIILTDTPVLFWILGAFFSSVFAITFIVLIVLVFNKPHQFITLNPTKLSDSAFSIVFFGLILLFLLVFFFIFFAMIFVAKISVKVNREQKIVEIIRQRVFFKKAERYYFSQISRFETFTKSDRDLPELVLILSNETKAHLEIRHQLPEEFLNIVQRLNSFIIR